VDLPNLRSSAVSKRSLQNFVPFGIAAFAALMFALLVGARLGEGYSIDYDEGVFLTSAYMARRGFPLYQTIFSAQGPAYLRLLVLAFQSLEESVEVARAVSLCFAVVSLCAVGWLIGCRAYSVGGRSVRHGVPARDWRERRDYACVLIRF
jgi:hypothetical protein